MPRSDEICYGHAMIMRTLIASLALSAAMSVALPAYAQDTDQTDQSEEDWRKSRKKSGSSDIYRKTNPNSTGSGAPMVDYKPVSPVERLPSESRRHVMRERAKAIAESDDGDISDVDYTPSDAAQSDEQLMRDEQEAWDTIVTDMKGDGGTAKSEGGPNKVAVTGENGATAEKGSRGGSTKTLQEIMDAIKNGQSGKNGPSGGGNASEGQGAESSSGSSEAQGESQADGTQGQSGQGDAQSDGESQSDGQSNGQDQGDGQDAGDAGADGDNSDAQATAEAWPAATRAEEPLSPLERIRRAKEEQPARGTQRSASDYLGNKPED